MPNENKQSDYTNLNLYQKLLKIADAAGALKKTKSGYNYNYVPEEDIQAKVTAGMQKYRVFLYPSIIPGSSKITPVTYKKIKSRKENDSNGKSVTTYYEEPVNEVIVSADITYTWVNADKPEEKIETGWVYVGQMEDASQAFGAGATYGNRYYLGKSLQLAITDADPDAYRGKQREAENYEENKEAKKALEALQTKKAEIIALGTQLIKQGLNKTELEAIISKYNNENPNPKSISTLEICEQILNELNKELEKR